MDRDKIKEGNELIAKFLGWFQKDGFEDSWYENKDFACYVVYGIHNNYPHRYLPFHRSWNDIMLVVDKIKKMKYPISMYNSHVQNTVHIFDLKGDHYIIRESDTIAEPIVVLWKAITQFIEIYNSEINKPKTK